MLRLSVIGKASAKLGAVSQKISKSISQRSTKKATIGSVAASAPHTTPHSESRGSNSIRSNSSAHTLSSANYKKNAPVTDYNNSSSVNNNINNTNEKMSGAIIPSKRGKKDESTIHFDASKAGLQLVDKNYVEQVIQEASKGSAFYEKEQRKDQIRRKKAEVIAKQALEYPKLSYAQKQAIKQSVDALEAELETTRDLRRRYIHLDMDMFFAAVEEKRNPRLRSIPFGVGSVGMLSTTNYIARQYGVRSGMPGFIGRKLCPDLHIVPVNMEAYKRESAIVQGIAARYDPHFVSLGLDELTMDVTRYLEQYPWLTASQIATDFREEVFIKTHLTCSAGIAPTSALSKIASNVNKPNGQYEITLLSKSDLLEYVRDIPLRKIPGIGYSQELQLNAIGIKTCGDLLKKKYLLYFLYKPKTFTHYLTVGLGLNEAFAHKQHEVRQSIGKESTFSEPLPSRAAFYQLFRKLLEPIHAQCVKEHILAQQMCLVLKSRAFESQQFSCKLPCATNDLKVWIDTSRELPAPHADNYTEFRLVGIRMQKLLPEQRWQRQESKKGNNNLDCECAESSISKKGTKTIDYGQFSKKGKVQQQHTKNNTKFNNDDSDEYNNDDDNVDNGNGENGNNKKTHYQSSTQNNKMPKRHQSNNTGSNAQRKDVKSKARNQITSSSSSLSAPTSSRVVITSNNKQSTANSSSRLGKSNNVKQVNAKSSTPTTAASTRNYAMSRTKKVKEAKVKEGEEQENEEQEFNTL